MKDLSPSQGLVSEHERKLPPYQRELFLQRLERMLAVPKLNPDTLSMAVALFSSRKGLAQQFD
jgi:hypothetical protein